MKRKHDGQNEELATKRTRTCYTNYDNNYAKEEAEGRTAAEIEQLTDRYFESSRFRLNIIQKRSKETVRHDINEDLYYKELQKKKSISKALNRRLPTRHFRLPKNYTIQVLSTPKKIDDWIKEHTSKSCIVGCDTEWDFFKIEDLDKPYSTTQSRYPDIITMATETSCLIFPTRFTPPDSLLTLLSDSTIKKVWCGMGEDSELLQNWLATLPPSEHVTKCSNALCNTDIHIDLHNILPKDCHGGKKMVSRVLGLIIKKDIKLTMSRWSRWELTFEQKEYAAIDALVNLRVYKKWTRKN